MTPKVRKFWSRFLATRPDPEADRGHLRAVFAFDDNAEGADFCANAVLAGEKTATSTLAADFDGDHRRPEPGDLEIVTFFDGAPCAVIRFTHVDTAAFGAIDETFASEEGDGSLASWRETHTRYYGARCRERGEELTEQTLLLRIWFERLHPAP